MKFQQLSVFALSAFVIVGHAAPIADANGVALQERKFTSSSVDTADGALNDILSRDLAERDVIYDLEARSDDSAGLEARAQCKRCKKGVDEEATLEARYMTYRKGKGGRGPSA